MSWISIQPSEVRYLRGVHWQSVPWDMGPKMRRISKLVHLLMGLPVEVWPVSKRTSHHHGMDVIEWVAEVPWLLEIVNFKLYVWWLCGMLISSIP